MIIKSKAERYNLFLNTEHEEILNKIIELKNLGELKSTSKVVRFIILDYYERLTTIEQPKTSDVKLNAMSKDVSIILNLLCSLIANTPSLNVGDKHARNENVLLYWQSLEYVEAIINKRRTGHGERPVMPAEFKDKMETTSKPFDQSYLEQLEREKFDAEFNKIFDFEPVKIGE